MPGSASCPFVSAKRTFHSLIRDTPDLIITTVVVILIMSAKERTTKMVTIIDSNKAVEISIREWDEENTQYGPDWSADFYNVGSLQQVPDLSDYTDADLAELGLPPRAVIQLDDVVEPSGRFIDGIGTFACDGDGYLVDDVDYCIEQANDMVAGVGDFAEDGPQPNQVVDVTEIDRSAYPAL